MASLNCDLQRLILKSGCDVFSVILKNVPKSYFSKNCQNWTSGCFHRKVVARLPKWRDRACIIRQSTKIWGRALQGGFPFFPEFSSILSLIIQGATYLLGYKLSSCLEFFSFEFVKLVWSANPVISQEKWYNFCIEYSTNVSLRYKPVSHWCSLL